MSKPNIVHIEKVIEECISILMPNDVLSYICSHFTRKGFQFSQKIYNRRMNKLEALANQLSMNATNWVCNECWKNGYMRVYTVDHICGKMRLCRKKRTNENEKRHIRRKLLHGFNSFDCINSSCEKGCTYTFFLRKIDAEILKYKIRLYSDPSSNKVLYDENSMQINIEKGGLG